MKTLLYTVLLLQSLTLFGQNTSYTEILKEHFDESGPGAAAIVVKDGKTIFEGSIGMANLELKVPMKANHIFRIGSISKQFTACAILKLEEEGKLSLQEDIKKYFPEFPIKENQINIEHLLTHTSGIKSYTSMPKWNDAKRREDMLPEAIVSFFQNEPRDFKPGTKWSYNNSGYIMLGIIIEKVSGMPYKEYLNSTFFAPLGMHNTSYDNTLSVIENRIPGYSKDQNGYTNAAYLSMSQPYAAGALLSTVQDLNIWYQAVMDGKVIQQKNLQRAHTAYRLKDGKATNYGYGWMFSTLQEAKVIEHGGGINGFLTASMYLPEEKVFVALFSNCNCNAPSIPASKMAALAINKPYAYADYPVASETLSKYVGVYRSEEGEERSIVLLDDQLWSQRSGAPSFGLHPFKPHQFYFKEALLTLTFIEENGKITSVVSSGRNGKTNWTKTNKKPTTRTKVQVSPSVLKNYVGTYTLQPGFNLVVTLKENQLYVQATGQSNFEVYPESETKFYYTVVDAQITFKTDSNNKTTELILHQGGRNMPAKRIN